MAAAGEAAVRVAGFALYSATSVARTAIFVTGSDTGVGKTQVAAALAHAACRAGRVVAVRKPIETGGGDAEVLRDAAGGREPIERIAPYRFAEPVSPERAVLASGATVTLDDLVRASQPDAPAEMVIVEGAGGFLSPAAPGVLCGDVAAALGHPLWIVVPNRLGAINQSLLVVEAARARGLEVAAVVLNGAVEPPVPSNVQDVARWTGCRVVVLPRVAASRPWRVLADHVGRAALASA